MKSDEVAKASALVERLGALSPEKQALLARRLAVRAEARGGMAADLIVPRADSGPAPLTAAQELLWLYEQKLPGTSAYNFPMARRIRGSIDVAALERALGVLVERHESLRTAFREIDAAPWQIVLDPRAVDVEQYDLRGASPESRDGEAERVLRQVAEQPFDLAAGSFPRIVVVRLADDESLLLIVVHHIVFDGASVNLLFRELALAYEAEVSGTASGLLPPSVQLADVAVWERRPGNEARIAAALSYWREYLAGAPSSVDLPTDSPRPATATGPGARFATTLSPTTRRAMHAIAAAHATTPFVVLLAAFQALLHRYSAQDDVVVGTVVAGRGRAETSGVLGYLANTLACRARFEGNPTFATLIAQVRLGMVHALGQPEVPYEKLVQTLRAEVPPHERALFDVMLTMQDASGGIGRLGTATLEPLGIDIGAAKFDLSVSATDAPHGIRMVVEYRSDLFRPETIQRFIGHFETLLLSASAAPHAAISELVLLGAEERNLVLDEWNDTAVDMPRDATLITLIDAQAMQSPAAIAVEDARRTLTFGELQRASAVLARRLIAVGVGRGARVGICAERSVELVVALVAVLKAGAAYVPLDPEYPADRLAFMLDDADVAVLLTTGSVAGLRAGAAQIIELEGVAEPTDVFSDALPGPRGDDVAYMIYTSGSTGRPKGALNTHSGIVNRLLWMQSEYMLSPRDVVLQKTPFSFDVSVWEFFWPLITGARIVMARPEGHRDTAYLASVMRERGVTVCHFVPSMLRAFLADSGARECTALRDVMASGEALPPDLVATFSRTLPGARLHNLYGPTECAIDVSYWPCPQSLVPPAVVPIGRPVSNTRLYVLERSGAPAPIGIPGELHIAGAQVGRGYHHRPELTAERFIPDPFAPASLPHGARMYRTGDRARWRADGTVEYLGRLDFQVKVRGVRIELGEVESALLEQPGVTAAVAIVAADHPGEPRLVAYVVRAADAAIPSVLRDALALTLPAAMVPTQIVELDALPLTPSGKLDRKALPAPPELRSTREYLAPRTPTEVVVAAVFADVLGVERVGAADNFHDLGGHSLLALRIAGRLRERLPVAVTTRLVFEHQTVAALAEALDQLDGGARLGPSRIPIVSRDSMRRRAEDFGHPDASGDVLVFPASFAQTRLWFIEELSPGNSTYNVPIAWRLRGQVDAAALQSAVNEMCARHDVLRTTFEVDGDMPVQLVHRDIRVDVSFRDFSGDGDAAARAWAAMRTEANTPFDLRRGPLIRVALLRSAPGDQLLVVTLHHIISDGWSMVVLRKELAEGYAAALAARAPHLPALSIQYADYAVWQRRELSGDVAHRLEAYWRERLRGPLPVLDLPMQAPRPAMLGVRTARQFTFRVVESLASAVDALAREERATPFTVYLAAFQVLLGRYSGQHDVVVGTPVSGRGAPEVEPLLGIFLNTVALRTDLSGSPPFRSLLKRVRENTLEDLAHDALPFERVVDVVKPTRNPSITPIFQILFSMQNATATAMQAESVDELALPGVTTERVRAGLENTKFDIQLTLAPDGAAYHASVDYDADLFAASVIERFAGHYLNLLNGIVASPDQRIDQLALLDSTERHRVVSEWNATATDDAGEPGTLPELIANQARRSPDATAVLSGEASLTFAELDARATTLARALRARGVARGSLVGVCMDRSFELVVALLGILKAGGAYVPMDPEYPASRLRFMIDDARCALLLTQERIAQSTLDGIAEHASSDAVGVGAQIICLDSDWSNIVTDAQLVPTLPVVSPDDLAYMIYTSGSTGRPKGALNRHRGIVNRLRWMQRAYSLEADDVVMQKTPISFDVSVWEFFWPLATGAQLLLADPGGHRDAAYLAAVIRERRVTVLHFVPSMLRAFLESGVSVTPTTIRDVICSGEALTYDLQQSFFDRFPTTRLHNLYGPTEAAVDVSAWECVRGDTRHVVPIGRPIANTRLYVLDDNRAPTPIDVAGELYIGGIQVGAGYHNRPELTAERFVPDPFSLEADARLYRTGDRARWLSDGAIEYLGRLDFQVKLRGFRIELGEIEMVLTSQPGVRSAVALVREDVPGDQRLVAYCVAEDGAGPSEWGVLRDRLKASLPSYMVPSAIVWLESWPLTPNGKLDRSALPAPVADGSKDPASFRTPENPVEEVIGSIFREVLGLTRVSTVDDFFDIGGHSLLAMQVVARSSRLFGRRIMLRDFFQHPTVIGFAEALASGEPTPGRTNAVARAIVRMRDMTPEEMERRRIAAASLRQATESRDGHE